jgi:hypothetical protein
MGLLDGLFGKRDDKFDWLELSATSWSEVGIRHDGVQYSIDRYSCFERDNTVWWKQRNGVPGHAFEYSICAGAIPGAIIGVVIARTLSDPGLKKLKRDELLQKVRGGADPLFYKSLQQASVWARCHNYQTPPPCYFYGLSILRS